MRHVLSVAIAVLLSSCAHQESMLDAEPNARLMQIYKEDQAARTSGKIDWSVVGAQDTARRAEVMEMLRAGQLRSAIDFSNAAIIFQHGTTADDYRLAFSLAWIFHSMVPEFKEYNIPALAWDRILESENQPRWYGTQYTTINGKTELYRINESAVTDEERSRMGVPSLSETKANAKNFDK